MILADRIKLSLDQSGRDPDPGATPLAPLSLRGANFSISEPYNMFVAQICLGFLYGFGERMSAASRNLALNAVSPLASVATRFCTASGVNNLDIVG